MNLPIDVIPNISPPQFRWREVIDGRVIACQGALPSHVEGAVALLIEQAKQQEQELEQLRARVQSAGVHVNKLQAFKDWVHAYLDAQGVPVEFPDRPHTREGCRVGDRLDYLVGTLDAEQVAKLALAEARLAELEAELAKCQEVIEGFAERIAAQSELLGKRAEADEPDVTETEVVQSAPTGSSSRKGRVR